MKMKMKHLLIIIITVFLSILPAPGLRGDMSDSSDYEMTIPVDTSMENLDEMSKKQLDYFLEIAKSVDILNQIDLFKPYNNVLKGKISQLLIKAGEIEADQCHKQYLNALADRVLADTFYSPVPGWFSLEENKTEIIFLRNEDRMQKELLLKLFVPIDKEIFNFEDRDPMERLNSLTASKEGEDRKQQGKIFDTFIYLNDPVETWKFGQYIKRFDKMQDKLPAYTTPKLPYTPRPPAIKIARLVYSSLPNKASLVYPDRQTFYTYGRFKIVIFKNLIDSYVECILKPIAEEILTDNRLMEIDTEYYLANLVIFKISHHMGPLFSVRDKVYNTKVKSEKKEKILKLTVENFGNMAPAVEELKARTIALHNISVLIEEGLIPKEKEINLYASYLVSLVDRLRKNPGSSAENVQFNYLLEKGAIVFNINNRKLSIHSANFETGVKALAEEVLKNYTSIYRFMSEYRNPRPELETILGYVKKVPLKTGFQFDDKTGILSKEEN